MLYLWRSEYLANGGRGYILAAAANPEEARINARAKLIEDLYDDEEEVLAANQALIERDLAPEPQLIYDNVYFVDGPE